LGGVSPQSLQEVHVASPWASYRRSSNVYHCQQLEQSGSPCQGHIAALLASDAAALSSLSLKSTLQRLTRFEAKSTYSKLNMRNQPPNNAPEQADFVQEFGNFLRSLLRPRRLVVDFACLHPRPRVDLDIIILRQYNDLIQLRLSGVELSAHHLLGLISIARLHCGPFA
jgi:hypothetical protein